MKLLIEKLLLLSKLLSMMLFLWSYLLFKIQNLLVMF